MDRKQQSPHPRRPVRNTSSAGHGVPRQQAAQQRENQHDVRRMQQQVSGMEDARVQIYPVAVGGLHRGRKMRRMSQQPVESVTDGHIEVPVRSAPEPDQMGG